MQALNTKHKMRRFTVSSPTSPPLYPWVIAALPVDKQDVWKNSLIIELLISLQPLHLDRISPLSSDPIRHKTEFWELRSLRVLPHETTRGHVCIIENKCLITDQLFWSDITSCCSLGCSSKSHTIHPNHLFRVFVNEVINPKATSLCSNMCQKTKKWRLRPSKDLITNV